jgi:hypothetical protein
MNKIDEFAYRVHIMVRYMNSGGYLDSKHPDLVRIFYTIAMRLKNHLKPIHGY